MKTKKKIIHSQRIKLLKLDWLFHINKEAKSKKGIDNYIRDYLTYQAELAGDKEYNKKDFIYFLRHRFQYKKDTYTKKQYSEIKYWKAIRYFPFVMVAILIPPLVWDIAIYSFLVFIFYILYLIRLLLINNSYSRQKGNIYNYAYNKLDELYNNENKLKEYWSTLKVSNLNYEKHPIHNISQSTLSELIALPIILGIIDEKTRKKLNLKIISDYINEHYYLTSGEKLDRLESYISDHCNNGKDNPKIDLIKRLCDKIKKPDKIVKLLFNHVKEKEIKKAFLSKMKIKDNEIVINSLFNKLEDSERMNIIHKLFKRMTSEDKIKLIELFHKENKTLT